MLPAEFSLDVCFFDEFGHDLVDLFESVLEMVDGDFAPALRAMSEAFDRCLADEVERSVFKCILWFCVWHNNRSF